MTKRMSNPPPDISQRPPPPPSPPAPGGGTQHSDRLFGGKAVTAKERITASAIRTAIADRFAPPEYAVMHEVGEGTGANTGRYADVVIMSLWPSRGLELHGVEIKVTRNDWKREAADPSKAETIAKYCDRWWVITPPGVIDDLSDVPPAWGLREFDGKSWETVREAAITEAIPVDRSFLAALLRRADGAMRADVGRAARAAIAAEKEAIDRRVEQEVQMRSAIRDNLFEAATLIRAEFGLDVHNLIHQREFVAAMKTAVLMHRSGIVGDYSGADMLLKSVETNVKAARRELAKLNGKGRRRNQ